MKILITGGSGLLGQYLNIELSKQHEIHTIYHKHIRNCELFSSSRADINDFNRIENIFQDFKPDVVLHTAAVTSVSDARSLPSKVVFSTNVTSSEKISSLSKKYNAKIIYTSTDLVYAGYRGSFLNENSKLIPASLYAETKLMGEEKVKTASDNFLILRLSLLYGFGLYGLKPHFHQVYDNLKQGKEVKLFTDQFRTPLELSNAAEIIGKLIQLDVKDETINVGGSERISRFELGELLCSIAGFDKKLLIPITMDQFDDMPVVEDVSMDISRLKSLGIEPENLSPSIKKILNFK
jgi:dTDP-4-dehydrorhamnose reductase